MTPRLARPWDMLVKAALGSGAARPSQSLRLPSMVGWAQADKTSAAGNDRKRNRMAHRPGRRTGWSLRRVRGIVWLVYSIPQTGGTMRHSLVILLGMLLSPAAALAQTEAPPACRLLEPDKPH